MQESKTTSEVTDYWIYMWISLNLLGLIGCVCIYIIFILWALDVILAEPDLSPPVIEFIRRVQINTTMRAYDDGFETNIYLQLSPRNSAADHSKLIADIFNMSILSLIVFAVIVVGFAIFTKIQ